MSELNLAWMCAAEEKSKAKKPPNLNYFFQWEVKVVSQAVLHTTASSPAMENNRHILSTFTFYAWDWCSLYLVFLAVTCQPGTSGLWIRKVKGFMITAWFLQAGANSSLQGHGLQEPGERLVADLTFFLTLP